MGNRNARYHTNVERNQIADPRLATGPDEIVEKVEDSDSENENFRHEEVEENVKGDKTEIKEKGTFKRY
jgi:hypothetical protein